MRKARKKKVRVEGVWIEAARRDDQKENVAMNLTANYGKDGEDKGLEEDEMIWWHWDGKIVGFSGW